MTIAKQSDQEIYQKLKWMGRLRFLAALVLLLTFLVLHLFKWLIFPFWYFTLPCLFEMFLNQPYSRVVRCFKSPEHYFHFQQILDILAITLGIHFVGGMDCFVAVLVYPLGFIVTGIFLVDRKKTLLIANYSFVCYALMVALEYFEVIARVPSFQVEMGGGERFVFTLLVLPLFNLIGYFVAHMTGLVKIKEDQLQKTNVQLMESGHELEVANSRLQEQGLKLQTVNTQLSKRAQEVEIMNQQLKKDQERLSKLNSLMVDREITMLNLKGEVNQLLREVGRPDRYEVSKKDNEKKL